MLAMLMIATTAALAVPGDVVASYGTGGSHLIPHDGGPHWMGDIAARPTGEVLVTGSSVGAGSGEQAFWVSEIAADGMSRSDATDIGLSSEHEFGAAIALQPDGSFFVAGDRGAVGGVDTDMFVASFDAGLELDPAFNDTDPATKAGVHVFAETGTEHATSVFVDNSHVVVGGWNATTGYPGVVWRVDAATGTVDPTFATGGRVTINWTDAAVFDTVETVIAPTGATNYLAIGYLNGGKASEMAVRTVSDTGTLGPDSTFQSAAVTSYDVIPLSDGGVAVAVTSFGIPNDGLTVTKLAADGSTVWQTTSIPIDTFSTDSSIEELRDGTLAVAVSTNALGTSFDSQVIHLSAGGALLGTLVTEAEFGALLPATQVQASAVASIDGHFFIGTITNPSTAGDELAVTRFEGDSSGRFVDDDGSTHEANIERLAAAGITSGCDPANLALFCPDDDVSRAQMASFLTEAASLPPATPGFDPFSDDDGNTHEASINAIAQAAVTLGCDPADPTRYCPADPVTRAQMATFLVRAFDLDTLVTPADPDPFTDDDGSVHEPNIAILFEAGITLGCDPADPGRYCPADPVTRAQMASFIMRTLDFIGP